MPTITKIVEQKKRPNRRNIYLDGAFAFGLNDNVVARFRLREGLTLTDDREERVRAAYGVTLLNEPVTVGCSV